jgi:peptidoglycan hydrolase-like protein with peptidoglycan-binding domain
MRKFIIPAKTLEAPQEATLPPKESHMTPDKVRQAKSKQALLGSGGKRVSVNLSGQAVGHLEAIKKRDGTDNTQAIIDALGRHSSTSKNP